MIISIIHQQVVGIFKMSLPLIVAFYFFGDSLFSLWAISLCSVAYGLFLAYGLYTTTKNTEQSLQFVPAQKYMSLFGNEIQRCGLDPKDICLRYAYADDGVAVTMFNTIAIDPMIWKEIDDDAEFIKAKDVIEKLILPGVPEGKKKIHARIKETICPKVQRFIFRHELGHVLYNYSNKSIAVTGITGSFVACVGIISASIAIITLGGMMAYLVGLMVSTTANFVLVYLSNGFFKAQEEKKADLFAATFSSKEEIEAAADFFEAFEESAQDYRKNTLGVLNTVPTVFLTGYMAGRAHYLREISR